MRELARGCDLPCLDDLEGTTLPECLGFIARPSVDEAKPRLPVLLLALCVELDPSGLYILLAGGFPNYFE